MYASIANDIYRERTGRACAALLRPLVDVQEQPRILKSCLKQPKKNIINGENVCNAEEDIVITADGARLLSRRAPAELPVLT